MGHDGIEAGPTAPDGPAAPARRRHRQLDWQEAGRAWGITAVAIVGIAAATFATLNWKPPPPEDWTPRLAANRQPMASRSNLASSPLAGEQSTTEAAAQPAGGPIGTAGALDGQRELPGQLPPPPEAPADDRGAPVPDLQVRPLVAPSAMASAEPAPPARAPSASPPISAGAEPANQPIAAAAVASASLPPSYPAPQPARAVSSASPVPTVALASVREVTGGGSAGAPARWISGGPQDSDNRRGRLKGTVLVRFVVQPEGRVSNCGIVRGSGNADLDAATCRLVEARAVFNPAIGNDGRPVASTTEATYVWGRRRRD